MPRANRRQSEGCELNMTPMIDVVFQLIIFFVVTLKMTKEINPDIVLEDGKHGETITAENQPKQTIEIEINSIPRLRRDGARSYYSIHNAILSKAQLQAILQNRFNRFGAFPVLIRADRRAKHADVKAVMDICTGVGLWKVGIVAIQDKRTGK